MLEYEKLEKMLENHLIIKVVDAVILSISHAYMCDGTNTVELNRIRGYDAVLFLSKYEQIK